MSLYFAPVPENDFGQFIATMYARCRQVSPLLTAIAGKWNFEDLLPGLSDFDTRFFMSNETTAEDWCALSGGVGWVHLELLRERPAWARNLEHLPGMSLTWREATDEIWYSPEVRQWTIYDTDQPAYLSALHSFHSARRWDHKDEAFHLEKFAGYFAPYDPTIDPPINLGDQTPKHALHSRVMHWFNPAVKAAVCLAGRETIGGKREAFRRARELFSEIEATTGVFSQCLELVEGHYEKPELYLAPALSDFEERLFAVLQEMAHRLSSQLALIPEDLRERPEEWKSALSALPVSPALRVFDLTKFARFTKGRLQYYLNAPEFFDIGDLLRVELGRIGEWFFKRPFTIYAHAVWDDGERGAPAAVDRLRGELLTPEEAEAALEFARLAKGPWEGQERETVAAIVSVFDPFYMGIHKLTYALREREEELSAAGS